MANRASASFCIVPDRICAKPAPVCPRRRMPRAVPGPAQSDLAQQTFVVEEKSFAPSPLQALLRSYGRSDSCSRRLGSAGIIVRRPPPRLLREQVSLIHAPGLPTLPSPTTCGCFVSSGHVTHRRIEPRSLPHGSSPNGNSELRLSAADSPHHTGRIKFLIVRTSGSPPAAPHPVSPRRSCSRLQVTLTWRGLSPLQPGALSGALPRASRP